LQRPSITIVEGDYHYHVDGKRFIISFILLFWQTTSILPHLYIKILYKLLLYKWIQIFIDTERKNENVIESNW
jgi:hypothetical protein